MRPLSTPPPAPGTNSVLKGFFGVFRHSRRAIGLVWETSPALLLAFALLTVVAGLVPAAIAWVGAQIVDAVLLARANHAVGIWPALRLVIAEGLLVSLLAGIQRGLSLCQALLRAQLGQRARPGGPVENVRSASLYG